MLEFRIPLGGRPRIRHMGRGVHGRVPVERYRLRGLWCLHLYRYRAGLSVGGTELAIEPGFLSVLPADTELVYRFEGRSEHLFAHFEPSAEGPLLPVPAIQDTGAEFPRVQRLFEEAVGMFPTQPLRAEVRLWDLLWGAVPGPSAGEAGSGGMPQPVAETIRRIELRLHEPLLVESLAREAGLSHNHLTRLFRAATGNTVKGYMTERRMEKALHLLRKSSAPIKNIAGETGFDDLHGFNKAVRRRFGLSPRALREKKGRSA